MAKLQWRKGCCTKRVLVKGGPKSLREEQQDEEDEDCLRTYLDGAVPDKIEDQFNYFTTADPTPIPQNQLYNWWSEQDRLLHLRQMAYDLLSIPAISAETECIFSNTKLMISPNRTCLNADIIEAEECLQA